MQPLRNDGAVRRVVERIESLFQLQNGSRSGDLLACPSRAPDVSGLRWTKERVTALRSHHEIPCYSVEKRKSEGWMNLTEAATSLGVSSRTLRIAVERREIEAEHPLADGPWVINQRALETDAVAKFVALVRNNNRDHAIPTLMQHDLEFPTCASPELRAPLK